MPKFLNKYTRKIHRWLVIPFVIVVFTLTFIIGAPAGPAGGGGNMQWLRQLQQVLMFCLIVTGVYLFLLPYLTKWLRKRRGKKK